MTSVGLVGLDYCGSTLVNNILGGLPGCLGAGETHWIIDGERSLKNNVDRCTECVELNCPVFTDRLLRMLRNDMELNKSTWWKSIAEGTGHEFVVSGDKRPSHFERLGLPDMLIFIVKDPRSHIVSRAARSKRRSNLVHYGEGAPEFSLDDDELALEMDNWLKHTKGHINWALRTKKPLLAISLESLIENKVPYLESIANWIGVENEPSALNFWEKDLHYIGGNHSIKRIDGTRYFYRDLKIDKRWTEVLSEAQSELILGDLDVNYQLRRLEMLTPQKTEFFQLT